MTPAERVKLYDKIGEVRVAPLKKKTYRRHVEPVGDGNPKPGCVKPHIPKPIPPSVLAASADELVAAGYGNWERSRIPGDWKSKPRARGVDE